MENLTKIINLRNFRTTNTFYGPAILVVIKSTVLNFDNLLKVHSFTCDIDCRISLYSRVICINIALVLSKICDTHSPYFQDKLVFFVVIMKLAQAETLLRQLFATFCPPDLKSRISKPQNKLRLC